MELTEEIKKYIKEYLKENLTIEITQKEEAMAYSGTCVELSVSLYIEYENISNSSCYINIPDKN